MSKWDIPLADSKNIYQKNGCCFVDFLVSLSYYGHFDKICNQLALSELRFP